MIRKLAIPLFLIAVTCTNSSFAQNREILGEYKIGIIGRELNNPIYQAAQLGAQDAALELSRKYSIDIELLTLTPDTDKGADQSLAMGELFVQNADGFIISPEDNASVRASIEFAQTQGQQIVFFEHDLAGVQPLTTVLADETEAGRLAAEAMLKALPDRSRVAILTSATSDARLEQRLAAVRATLGYKRIHETVSCQPNYHSAIRAIEDAQRADTNHMISGWIFLSDWPLSGMPALPWKAGKFPTVAIQSSPSAFLYIDQGYINSLVVHPYYQWGYQSVELLIQQLHNGQQPKATQNISPPQLVDWQNISQYRESWTRWLK